MALDPEISNRFDFHPATDVTGPKHNETREVHKNMAEWVTVNIPVGRHQFLALTALQQSMMWCNAGIACDS